MESSENCKCGSELARDEVGTFNIDADCQTAIASRLAPTGIGSGHKGQGLQNGGYLKAKRRPLAAV
jgi:hypothetical protein